MLSQERSADSWFFEDVREITSGIERGITQYLTCRSSPVVSNTLPITENGATRGSPGLRAATLL